MVDVSKSISFSPCIVSPVTPLAEAIMLMTQAKGNHCPVMSDEEPEVVLPAKSQPTSCILVVENESLVGILTERDLVKLAVKTTAFEKTTVRDVMTSPVVMLFYREFSDLFIAYNLMRRHRIRHLPILNDRGYPLGLVTLSSLRQTLNLGYFLRFRQVNEIMTHHVVWAFPNTPIVELAQIMSVHRISCIVLVEDRGGILIPVGIITERDIVQFQAIALDLQKLTAEQVMSSPLFCLKPEDTLATVHQKMEQLRIRRLVVTGKEGELLGLVTESNLSQVLDPIEIYGILEILQHRVTQLEAEKAYLLQKQGIELHEAIEKNQFELYYQPQLNLTTQKIIGAEALIRWHSPERGLVSPAEFIPLAENTGLIIPLGQWILESVCQQIIAWEKSGLNPVHISVNVSSKQFQQVNLADNILTTLKKYQVKPQWLKLELTESLLVQNIEIALEQFKILKAAGIKIAIDDFGTGYASLGYLQHFPFDTLKIDRCFVQGIHHNAKSAAITTAIIRMAQQLNFEVIAEGVETAAERDFLYQHGCELIQGYLISRPLPVTEFTNLLISG
jgi:EAL domain-containing protein (putative c-di-GMP-specific phosphodiesterase class I)/CBS domain-containing protein